MASDSEFNPLVQDQHCVKVSCHCGRSVSIRPCGCAKASRRKAKHLKPYTDLSTDWMLRGQTPFCYLVFFRRSHHTMAMDKHFPCRFFIYCSVAAWWARKTRVATHTTDNHIPSEAIAHFSDGWHWASFLRETFQLCSVLKTLLSFFWPLKTAMSSLRACWFQTSLHVPLSERTCRCLFFFTWHSSAYHCRNAGKDCLIAKRTKRFSDVACACIGPPRKRERAAHEPPTSSSR